MWNLVKGRCTYTAPLEEEAQHVAFDNEGGMYALLTGNKLTVFSTVLDNDKNDADDGVVAVFSYERRLLCMAWVNKGDDEKILLAGGEDGSMHIIRLNSDKKKKTLQHGSIKQAHATRIKGIIVVVNPASSSMLCGSAASDGVIKLWNLTTIIAQLTSSSEEEDSVVIDGDECVISEARTTARLTSLCALDFKSDMEAGAKVDTHRKKQHTQQQNVVNSNKTHGGGSKKENNGGGRKRKGVEAVEKKKEKKEEGEEEGKGGGELVDFVTKEELETMKKKQQHRVHTVQAKKKNMVKKQNRERQGREGE